MEAWLVKEKEYNRETVVNSKRGGIPGWLSSSVRPKCGLSIIMLFSSFPY